MKKLWAKLTDDKGKLHGVIALRRDTAEPGTRITVRHLAYMLHGTLEEVEDDEITSDPITDLAAARKEIKEKTGGVVRPSNIKVDVKIGEPPTPKQIEAFAKYIERNALDLIGADLMTSGPAFAKDESHFVHFDLLKHPDTKVSSLEVPIDPEHIEALEKQADVCHYARPKLIKIGGEPVSCEILKGVRPSYLRGEKLDQAVSARLDIATRIRDEAHARIARRIREWPYCGHTQRNVSVVWIDNLAYWQCVECNPHP